MDMHRTYVAKPIDQDGLAKTYPLLRGVGGLDDITAWSRFLARSTSTLGANRDARGAIGVENSRGYLIGVFFYQVAEDAPWGRTLECENFVVADLPRSDRPFDALVTAAEELARRLDCGHLRISMAHCGEPDGSIPSGHHNVLRDRSFAFESVCFSKPVGIASEPNLR